LVLSVVLFVFLSLGWYMTGMVLFIVAAATDWIDGYWARKYGQVTQLGRILDPFADKLIICGTFIYLSAVPESMVAAWMTVIIVGRELLVTALRSFLEERGSDFSASMSGKLKMVIQCVAVGFSLFRLSYLDPSDAGQWTTQPPDWVDAGLLGFVWAAVIITVYSGVGYIFAAVRMLRG
jgi:CDP-diacylglycerol--glycerol-3-phosphate 3-phosphatidyltransferase